ncbi:UDP-N-acetylmuramoyl-tripeptide--D-alanyl-D-alanine ligase [mine drainage metagenome]|uniref:UDP-MurNAc-pentapeptide synthetase n=1 Tax=mine drainage metagenome TaxID=410659 RepID=A0A1J5QEP5_9ZZZZ
MMPLSEAALATKGQLLGPDVEFGAISTDSRRVEAGDLFVALRGERFDGHDYVADCLQRGAVAAVVEAQSAVSSRPSDKSLLVVADGRIALGALARHWRGKFSLPLIAVTGSNGKTTVKEMLASILRAAAGRDDAVLATTGNLNNEIGVPLTLFRLDAGHRYAVIEMGMNHAGEIARLTAIARPTVALVNNALPAHLEGLGSVAGVAHAKGEIFQGLAADGTAVINADDAFAPLWRQLAAPHRVLSFGLQSAADVSADYRLKADGSEIVLKTPQGATVLNLPVAGLHNVSNALAATAAALAVEVPLDAVVAGLQRFAAARGRLQRKTGVQGCALIDDTYNANPASMRAAIDVLAACPGRRYLVLGDMGELGEDAGKLHHEIGEYARAAKLEGVLTLGEMGRAYGGQHFDSPEALAATLLPELGANSTVLVKGSRFMRMERVVALLTETEQKESRHAA